MFGQVILNNTCWTENTESHLIFAEGFRIISKVKPASESKFKELYPTIHTILTSYLDWHLTMTR